MKILAYVCIIASLAVIVIGVIVKVLIPALGVRPASFLYLAQIFLLLGINLALLELIKK